MWKKKKEEKNGKRKDSLPPKRPASPDNQFKGGGYR